LAAVSAFLAADKQGQSSKQYAGLLKAAAAHADCIMHLSRLTA
jgi:hypothetical protein